mgnify:FL=1|jgi:ComF family protein
MKTVMHSLLHLFLPHTCAGCNNDVLGREQLLCLSCIHRLPLTAFHLYANNPVEKIFRGRLPVTAAASLYYFTKNSVLQHLAHQLKYNGKREIGEYIGRRMGEMLLDAPRFANLDALVPLPLHPSRERKRGYNQSAVLCQGIAAVTGLPVLQRAIIRKSATDTQTRKSRMERWANISGRFEVTQPGLVRGKHVLLVDDVITTGATLESCGQALLDAGADGLSIYTMAYSSR